MKKFFLSAIALIWLGSAIAQQRPQFTQYFFNNFLINPAVGGIERYIDAKVGYRNQWVGISGAPVTSFAYIHAPIGKNYIFNNATSFDERGNNPSSRSFLQTYMAAEPHHGVGFYVVSDKAGPFENSSFNVTYAYHMGLSPQVNLSLGIAGGVSNDNLDINKIDIANRNDPAVINSLGTKINPEVGVGVWLYGPTFFAGFSGQQLLSNTSKVTFGGKQVPHFYFTGGYKVIVAEDISATPAIMVKYAAPAPPALDLNLKMMFKDIFWLGAGYRKEDSFSALAGFNVSSLFNISYAYDFPVSQIGRISSGSHEIILGVLLNNRYKVNCPQMLW